MADKPTMLATLRAYTACTTTEFDDTKLNDWLDKALAQHNRKYTFASLPVAEVDLVLFLAWIKVAMARAGQATQYYSLSGRAISGDKSQVMRNNLELMRELRQEYVTACGRTGINPAPEIIVSEFTVLDESISGYTPVNANIAPDPVLLTPTYASGATATLSWTEAKPRDAFVKYQVFVGTTAGLQDLTTLTDENPTYPGVDASKATLLGTYTDIWKTAIKASGLVAGTTYYFVVVLSDCNRRLSISNEVSVVAVA